MIHQRYVLLAFVLGSLMLAAVLQSAAVSIGDQLDVQDASLLGGFVNASDLIGLVGGLLTFMALIRNPAAVRFTDEVVGELVRVTWPSRDEALSASTTVIFTALFVSLVIGVYDFVWNKIAGLFLFSGS